MIIGTVGTEQIDDFRVSLTSSGDDLSIETEGTKERFRIPFSRDEVERALDDSSPNRISTDPLTSFGSTLFSSIFSGQVGRQFWGQFADAEKSNRGLRLRIVSSVERLQHLPWELLFDPSRGDFMSLSGRVALVRTRLEGYSDSPLRSLSRLRILAVEADVTGTMRSLEDVDILKGIASANPGTFELDILSRATPQTLRDKLKDGSYDVFHFAGTGEVLSVSRRGGLQQSLRLWGSGSLDPLFDRHELGELLQQAGVRLAVLNACHSDWIARSLARDIPSAIGLRENLSNDGCLAVCESLYRSLASATPLDLAVTAVRQAINRRLPGTGQWCKLILYLQRPDGFFLLDPGLADEGSIDLQPPRTNKTTAKLSRLLNVYQLNLNAVERLAEPRVVRSPDVGQDLRLKIDDLKRQLKDLSEDA
jgi:hypothetical protein